MIAPVPNQWWIALRLGVYSTLLIAVLVLTAVMPLIAQDAETDSTQLQTLLTNKQWFGDFNKIAAKMMNPNVWFHNAAVAAARVIGRETIQYVSYIYKYYIAYRMVTEQRETKQKLLHENSAGIKKGLGICHQKSSFVITGSHRAVCVSIERSYSGRTDHRHHYHSDGVFGAYSLANLLAVLSTGGRVGQTLAKVDNCIEAIFFGFII